MDNGLTGEGRELNKGVVTDLEFNGPISPPSIPGIYRNPFPGKNNDVPWIESSDRRLRNTETLFTAFR